MTLLLKFFLLAVTLLPANDNWQRINTTEHIAFLFPNNPQKLKKMVNGILSTIYQTKDLTCVAGVVCSDMSARKIKLTGETALAIYEELRAGTLNMETAILKNEITVPYENMLIKEIEYSIIKDKYEMTYFKRFIFRDNFIYQISIGGRSRHMNIIQKEREIFFNSITFPEEEENKKQKLQISSVTFHYIHPSYLQNDQRRI